MIQSIGSRSGSQHRRSLLQKRRAWLTWAATAVLVTTAACATTNTKTAHGDVTQTRFSWEGRERSFTLQTPATLRPNRPLILLLHLYQDVAGSAARHSGFESFADQAVQRGAVVVRPTGLKFSWNAGTCCGRARALNVDDVSFVKETIKRVRDRVGDRPVFAVGFSNGGFMALRLACEGMPLAGVAIVEATITVESCTPRPMDLLQIHQKGDAVVPYDGTTTATIATAPFVSVPDSFARWREAAGCGAPTSDKAADHVQTAGSRCRGETRAELITLPGGRHSWPTKPPAPIAASRAILDFFRL